VSALAGLVRQCSDAQAISEMVYLHFPTNLTEEELMLQNKYQKLRKKVIWIRFVLPTRFSHTRSFSTEKSAASAKSTAARTRAVARVESQETQGDGSRRPGDSEKTTEIWCHRSDKEGAESHRPRVVQETLRNGTQAVDYHPDSE